MAYAIVLHVFVSHSNVSQKRSELFGSISSSPYSLLMEEEKSFREGCACSLQIDQQNCLSRYHSARVLFDNSPFSWTFKLLKLFFLCYLFITFYCWALSFFSQTSDGVYKHMHGVPIDLIASVPQARLLNPAWGLLMTPIAYNRDRV